MDLKRRPGGGSIVLARMAPRNLELVRNLGLHRLLTIDAGELPVASQGEGGKVLDCRVQTELEQARLVLEAHENLVEADESNRAKFQDVLAFLKSRVAEG